MSMFKSESLICGFYWGPRQEAFNQCAQRCNDFLTRIAGVDESLRDWQVVDGDWRKKPKRLVLSKGSLEALVEQKWMRTDIGRQVVEDGGCSFMLSTASADTAPLTLSISCGASSQWLTNSCVLYLSPRRIASTRLLRVAGLIQLSTVAVQSLEPIHGVVASSDLAEAVEPEARQINVGWLTYLSASSYEPPDGIVSPSYVEPIGGLGHIIVAMDEQPDPSNRSHVKVLRDILSKIRPKKSER